MFRRFFQRGKLAPTPTPQQLAPPNANQTEHAKKIIQDLAKQAKDDGVHRMAIRTGKQPLPEDPDEQRYEREQGVEVELAQQALQAGDLKRSMYHLSLALASDPARDEWLALLDQWIGAAGTHALDLVPLNDQEYFTTLQVSQQLMSKGNTATHRMEVTPLVGKNYHARVAVHAFILAEQGRVKDAVTLLLQLLQVKPEIPYVLWLQRWRDQPGFADALDPEQVAPLVMRILQKYPGTYVFAEQGRAEIQCYLPLLRHISLALPKGDKQKSALVGASLYAMALRKTGAFEEAASVARALPATSYQTLVALAMAEEALGNLDASIAAYRQALTLQPDDVALHNDLGTLLRKQGKLVEALACYEESARLDPSDPYQLAIASAAYLHCLRAPASEKWFKRLQSMVPDQDTARRLFSFLQAPFLGTLPVPNESIINLMRNVKAQNLLGAADGKANAPFKIKMSALEAPSARLAARRMLDAHNIACDIHVAEETFSPDPRQPLHPVEYHIWRYEGMDPIPAMSPPDAAIAASIADLAQTSYALERWYALARPLGQRLRPDALTNLLSVMVHPPTTPSGWDEWDWLMAVQIASALTIASLETGWEGSRRKSALLSLIYGPMDWSGAAALIALAILAHQDMRIHIEFDQICCDLWHISPDSPVWPLERAMVFGLIFLNAYSNEAQQYIDAYFEQERRAREEKPAE